MKIDVEALIEKECITEEEVQGIIDKLVTVQCEGTGFEKYSAERGSAMKGAFKILKRYPQLTFREALNVMWYFVKQSRTTPCEVKGEILEDLEREAKEVPQVNHPATLN